MQNIGNNWGYLNNPGCWQEVLKYSSSLELRIMCVVNSSLNKLINTQAQLRERRNETLIAPQIWSILSDPKPEYLQFIPGFGSPTEQMDYQKICEAFPQDTCWEFCSEMENKFYSYKNTTLNKTWNTGFLKISSSSKRIEGDFATIIYYNKSKRESVLHIHHLPTQNLFNHPDRKNNLQIPRRFDTAPAIIHHQGEYKIAFNDNIEHPGTEVVNLILFSAKK